MTPRKREERAKLQGFSCAECEEYYKMKREEGLSEEQVKNKAFNPGEGRLKLKILLTNSHKHNA